MHETVDPSATQQIVHCTVNKVCGPMPNVMAALPNIGSPSAQRRKVWLVQ